MGNNRMPKPEGGKLHIQKNGYVYWSSASKWDNEKKRSVDNRVSIGKVVPDQQGMMYPNKKYFDIFGVDPGDKEKGKREKRAVQNPVFSPGKGKGAPPWEKGGKKIFFSRFDLNH